MPGTVLSPEKMVVKKTDKVTALMVLTFSSEEASNEEIKEAKVIPLIDVLKKEIQLDKVLRLTGGGEWVVNLYFDPRKTVQKINYKAEQ